MPGRNFQPNAYRYGANSSEKDDEITGVTGANFTTFYRENDTRLGGRWWSIDPKVKAWESPYAGYGNNPILYNDPMGDDPSTDVTKNEDGTYTVAGGKADGDRNIYVVDDKGKRTGEVVGKSLTEYSFLDESGKGVKGAVINPGDKSGVNFLNTEIVSKNLGLVEYMPNATGGETYDFKARGIEDRPEEMTADQYRYRGMPFEGVANFGNQDGAVLTFASARDIGNVAAGFVAGDNGLSWVNARAGFDALETYQQGSLSTEGQPTKRAERVGFNVGSKLFEKRKSERVIKESTNPFPRGPKY